MPSSTLDRSRTRAKPSDWVVVVPGQSPVDQADPVAQAAPAATRPLIRTAFAAPAPGVARPWKRSAALPSDIARYLPMLAMIGAFVAFTALLLGPKPLLTLGIVSPQFVAYQGESAEQVRYVLDDGWNTTAAVPGAMLMDWSESRTTPALRLTMGNPTAEPEVARLSADGTSIEEIRYRSAWPGIDAEIRAQTGGWAANFIVQPGVDPATIELEYVGATELTVDPAGRMRVRGADGVWIDGTPESWQDGPNGREPVESRYELRGGTRFGFFVGAYDASRPLVVDPPSERAD
jgi:hypothetical protein